MSNVIDKVEFNNMDEVGNDVIDNSEENENEVEGYVFVQGNIDYQVLNDLSFEEALAFFSS